MKPGPGLYTRSGDQSTLARVRRGGQSELIYRGTRFTGMAHHKHLLEVCSGTAKLTWTAAAAGCDVMDPVDKNTGWDLTTRGDLRSLMTLVRQFRPFVTHIAPVCRSFSVAYHPQPGSGKDGSTADQLDLQLALNLASLAKLVAALGLYVVIENPVGSRLFKLQEYQHLHSMTGFFFVRVNSCMLGVTHPVTGKPVWKGYRFLTNAPWLSGIGIECNRSHEHSTLHGTYCTASAEYPQSMCEVYAQLLLSGLSSAVELSHTLLPSPPAGPMFACINSMHMTQSWPNFPLFYTKGSLEIARLRMCPFSEGASSGSGDGPSVPAVDAETEDPLR